LRLDPLEPFLADPGPRERGTLYHDPRGIRFWNRARFTLTRHPSRDCRGAFSRCGLPDATALVWRMRFDKAAEAIADWENDTAAGLVRSLVETRASLGSSACRHQAHRHGRPARSAPRWHRLDHRLQDRRHPVAQGQARILLDPQLALEAYALINGGFTDVGRMPVPGFSISA
jgi:ATP-dependent helicase/nuclease subunit B